MFGGLSRITKPIMEYNKDAKVFNTMVEQIEVSDELSNIRRVLEALRYITIHQTGQMTQAWEPCVMELEEKMRHMKSLDKIFVDCKAEILDYIYKSFVKHELVLNVHVRFHFFFLVTHFPENFFDSDKIQEVIEVILALQDDFNFHEDVHKDLVGIKCRSLIALLERNEFVPPFAKMVDKISSQVKGIVIGDETKFLLKLMGIPMQIFKFARERYGNSCYFPGATTFNTATSYFKFLCKDRLLELTQLPGLNEYMCDCIMSSLKDLVGMKKIFKELDYRKELKHCLDHMHSTFVKQQEMFAVSPEYSVLKTMMIKYPNDIQRIQDEMEENLMELHLFIPPFKEYKLPPPPDHFKDPITHRVMINPVKIKDNMIMDKSTVFRLKFEKKNNPLDGEPIYYHEDVLPLQKEIQSWLDEHEV